ncbi:MAG: 2-amino-4-hydroxy-6-hydroxymethyldihydropteridine diphosphokinase [Nitrospirae bacterium]|nr:2-amino-4-hydroxy-6-hydroxymethyldihydropteridine diphosphokinase [Nitrospirota bacterium]MBI3594857.1 2-amino-4-hydroxy-6-hydroxymethyldihydropteridine diphosphokinase [Nitrospirota bacterium]
MIAFVGIGANLGNRLDTLQRTIARISRFPQTKLSGQSSYYETEPVGGVRQPDYLNAVLRIETSLSARILLTRFLQLEKMAGRIRTLLNAPRTLDIDLLFFGKQIINEEDLLIPHPRLHLRKFALIPLAEIAPEWKHPVFKKTVQELLKMNTSPESVQKLKHDFSETLEIK